MYFQIAYINDIFWKICGCMLGFVKSNLTFDLIYIPVDQSEHTRMYQIQNFQIFLWVQLDVSYSVQEFS